ncbi:MAG: PspC domain-containing protein [Chloroflexi bacterium]|nr:PspC domain-containing protein [Chloroflexota bacterium]
MNRRLHRSRSDTILGGVAAGLADYLNTDPALVRIAWALIVPLTGGAALVAYVVAWVVVPETPQTTEGGSDSETEADAAQPVAPSAARGDGRAGIAVGTGLILVGTWFLLREYLPSFNWGLVWPLAIMVIGVVIIIGALRSRVR